MSENWAPEELSPEEEAQMAEEVANASEDEPAQLQTGESKDDPPTLIDKRSPSQRFVEEAAPEGDESEQQAAKSEAEKTEESKPESPQQKKPRPPWFEAIPEDQRDEAAKYLDNMHAARHEAREQRRQTQEEAKRRAQLYETTIKETITKALAEQSAVERPPDPEIDPDGYAKYQERRAEEANKRAAELEQQSKQTREQQQQQEELASWLVDTESEFREDHPDYDDAVKFLAEKEISLLVDEGAPPSAAQQEVTAKINRRLTEYHEKGWNIAQWVYGQAVKNGWGQTQAQQARKPAPSAGEKTAEAITAGEKAARGLGAGGAAGGGELTLEDISNIKDPDEHDRAYTNWVNRQLGRNPDWM